MAATFTVEAKPVGAGSWTDLTRDLVNTVMRTSRGFSTVMPNDLVAAPSSFQFSVDNSVHNGAGLQGYYSPDHSNFGAIVAVGSAIRLKITANSTTYTKFVGWVEEIYPKAGKYEMQTVDVVVLGWMAHASTAPIDGLAAAVNKREDQLITSLAALVTFQPTATSLATGLDVYPYAFDDLDPERATVLDGLDSVAMSGFYRIWEKGDGTLVGETRQLRETYTAPILTLPDTASGGTPSLALMTGGLKCGRRRRHTMNLFRVTVHPRLVDVAAVVLYSLPIDGSTLFIEPGQSVSMDLNYRDPNQLAQRVGGFDMLISDGAGGSTIGASGALPAADFHFTSAAAGAGSDLSSFITTAVVYGATRAWVTLTNTGTVRAYYALLQCRGKGVYSYQTLTAGASSSGSQTAAGKTVVQIDCPYQPDPNFAAAAAAWCIAAFSASTTQLDQGASVFVPSNDEATMAALLAREISDPVAVSETVSGLAAGTYWINAEQMEIDERCNIKFTYLLAPMIPGAAWALGVAGASELGVDTNVAYF